jgi:hypothetical protein
LPLPDGGIGAMCMRAQDCPPGDACIFGYCLPLPGGG